MLLSFCEKGLKRLSFNRKVKGDRKNFKVIVVVFVLRADSGFEVVEFCI